MAEEDDDVIYRVDAGPKGVLEIMVKLVITGWQAGLDKIGLLEVLQEHAQRRLSEAKRSTDRFLDGDTVILDIEGNGCIDRLMGELETVGAIARRAGAGWYAGDR